MKKKIITVFLIILIIGILGGFVFLKKGFTLNGIFNTNGIERYLRKYVLDENDFSRLGVELYIVATQLNQSRKTIFGPFLETTKSETIRQVGYTKISEAELVKDNPHLFQKGSSCSHHRNQSSVLYQPSPLNYHLGLSEHKEVKLCVVIGICRLFGKYGRK